MICTYRAKRLRLPYGKVIPLLSQMNQVFVNFVVHVVRTSCKALQKHGTEQSGHPQEFAAYLASQGITKVPLDSFHGNHFNILFHIAAGLYSIKSHVVHFFDNVLSTGNQLLPAVSADVKETLFTTEVRALEFIDKHIAAPLWKLLQDISLARPLEPAGWLPRGGQIFTTLMNSGSSHHGIRTEHLHNEQNRAAPHSTCLFF